MESQLTKQIVVVELSEADESMAIEHVALFNDDGSVFEGFTGPDGAAGADGADGADGANGLSDVIVIATAIGTAAKTTASAEPAADTLVLLQFTNGNSAETPTVAFNGGAARAIKLGGTASVAAKLTVAANGIAMFFFDGTVLHQVGVYS